MVEKFAENLSKLRKEKGMSQKEAAAGLNISQALLSHYENGIRECGLDFLIKAAEFYSVTTDYLLGISESKQGFAGAFTIRDDIESDQSMNTLTVYRVASRMSESLTTIYDGDEYADEIHMLFGIILYRLILAEVKKGSFPKSWVPNIDLVDNAIYAQIMTALEEKLVRNEHSVDKRSSDELENAPLCVKTLVNAVQHYIHERCSDYGIDIPKDSCGLCSQEEDS